MTFIIILVIVVLLINIISTYNEFKSTEVQLQQEKSGIDVILRRRNDTIKQMRNSITAYMGHESETLIKVNAVRSGMSIEEMSAAEAQMGQAIRQFYAVVESHPQLRASEHFTTFQSSIAELENDLQAARRTYNATAAAYNKKISTIPTNLIAGIMKLQKVAFFEATEKERDIDEILF